MTRKVDTWMPLYVSDYDRKTSRLTLAEDGAYMRLIRDYWINGAPPDDDHRLALILRVDIKEWRRLRPVLAPFFTVGGGLWSHDRIEAELTKARARREVAAQNGRAGGRPKNPETSQKEPSGLSAGNPERKPEKSSSPSPPPSEVSEVAIAPSGAAGATPQRQAELALLAETLEAKGIGGAPAHDGDDRNPDAEAWVLAVSLLTKRGGLAKHQARTFFAGLLKRHSLRASEIYVALAHAEDAGTPDLQPYLTAAAQTAQRLRNDRPGPHPHRTVPDSRAAARTAVWSQLAAEEDSARVGGVT